MRLLLVRVSRNSLIVLTFLHINYSYSHSYAKYVPSVTSLTSGASQGPHIFNSRSYANYVTLVCCLFVCLALFVYIICFRSCICALIFEGWWPSYGCGKLGLYIERPSLMRTVFFTSPEAHAKSAFSLGVLPQFSQHDECCDIRKGGRGKYNQEQGT